MCIIFVKCFIVFGEMEDCTSSIRKRKWLNATWNSLKRYKSLIPLVVMFSGTIEAAIDSSNPPIEKRPDNGTE